MPNTHSQTHALPRNFQYKFLLFVELSCFGSCVFGFTGLQVCGGRIRQAQDYGNLGISRLAYYILGAKDEDLHDCAPLGNACGPAADRVGVENSPASLVMYVVIMPAKSLVGFELNC
jgi:hypothetical protein